MKSTRIVELIDLILRNLSANRLIVNDHLRDDVRWKINQG